MFTMVIHLRGSSKKDDDMNKLIILIVYRYIVFIKSSINIRNTVSVIEVKNQSNLLLERHNNTNTLRYEHRRHQ